MKVMLFVFITKRLTLFFGILLLLLNFQSCTESAKKDELSTIPTLENPDFDEIKLNALDSVQLGNHVINLWHWKLIDDRVVVQVSDEDSILFIYSFPDFELMYKYGKLGQGPGEYLAANWGLTKEKGAVMFYDINKKSLFNLKLHEDSIYVNETHLFYGNIEGEPSMTKPYTMIQRLNEEVFLMKVDDREATTLEIVNLKTPELLSSYPIVFKNRNPRAGYPPFNFNISYSNNFLVLGYKFMKRIEFYKITDNYNIEPTLIIGNDKDQSNIQEEWEPYYADIQNDGQYVYLANQLVEKDQLFTTIDVYTLSGTPVKRVRLDKYIHNILINPATKMLYAHAQLENVNHVYVYDFRFLVECHE